MLAMPNESDQGLFLGVGIDHYISDQLDDLSGAADEVATLGPRR